MPFRSRQSEQLFRSNTDSDQNTLSLHSLEWSKHSNVLYCISQARNNLIFLEIPKFAHFCTENAVLDQRPEQSVKRHKLCITFRSSAMFCPPLPMIAPAWLPWTSIFNEQSVYCKSRIKWNNFERT